MIIRLPPDLIAISEAIWDYSVTVPGDVASADTTEWPMELISVWDGSGDVQNYGSCRAINAVQN